MPTAIAFANYSQWWFDAMVRVVWQGAVVIGAVWLVIRLLPGISGDTRCWLWRLAYAKLFLSLLMGNPLALPVLPHPSPNDSSQPLTLQPPKTVPAKFNASTSATVAPAVSSGTSIDEALVLASEQNRGSLTPILCALWLCGVGFGLTRLAVEWREVRRIYRDSTPVPENSTREMLTPLAWRFDWRAVPELRTQSEIDSPLLIGARSPVIVLPHDLLEDCDAKELRFMVGHELAHGKRHDLAWAWLPALAQIVFFFHPCVWLAHREWRLSQELACDALTLQVLEAPAVDYGQVLLKVASLCRPQRRLEHATVAGVETYASLKTRLQALAPVPTPRGGYRPFAASLLALLAITFLPWRLTERAGAQGQDDTIIDLGTNADLHGWRPFPGDNPWNTSIESAPLNPKSADLIAQIGLDAPLIPAFGSQNSGGETGMPYLVVGGHEAKVPVDFLMMPDSDVGPYPVPSWAPVERNVTAIGDQHILVVDRDNKRLYEMWEPTWKGGSWHAQCGAIFDLTSNAVRTARYTSAAGSGLPIFPGLVRYDEIERGAIRHALRFEAPRTARGFLFPARHYASLSPDPNLPPMGLRVRLRSNFDTSSFGPQTRVILEALKTYGMFLSDNGVPWTLSGTPSEHWDESDLQQLRRVRGRDFEVVQSGPLTVAPPGVWPPPQPPWRVTGSSEKSFFRR
ncbi:regulatory protein BlaR1 [Abditibacteriota bacterium]|nr:regulatory protein BlaR1 [Abditibacteriota bacterium]